MTAKCRKKASTASAEMRRITAYQVEAKVANPSALKEAEAGLAEAQSELFQAQMERATARARLTRVLGEE